MTLEIKKLELEKMKVTCAKAEMEMRIFEANESIERLETNIKIQNKRIVEITEKLNNLNKDVSNE